MLPDLVITCLRCGMAHGAHALSRMSANAGGDAPGYRCAIAVEKGRLVGGFGSTVADTQQAQVDPAAGLSQGRGFLCDGCYEALDAVGLLTTHPRPPTASAHIDLDFLFDAPEGILPARTRGLIATYLAKALQ